MINKKVLFQPVAALCLFAFATSCRKEGVEPPGVVSENHAPTQRERYEAEIERIVAGSNMTVFATEVASNRLCNEIDKALNDQEAILLFDKMCDLALKQPIDAPSFYNLHSSFNWRQNYLLQLWYVTLDAFCFAQNHRQESFEDWNRLFSFFKRYTDEIAAVEQGLPPLDRFGWRWGTERGQYLLGIKGDLAQAVHVMRKFYFSKLVEGLSEEQKADILRRFEEVEKYAELPPDAPGKKKRRELEQ